MLKSSSDRNKYSLKSTRCSSKSIILLFGPRCVTTIFINHCVLQVFMSIHKHMQTSRQSNQGVLFVTASMIIIEPYMIISPALRLQLRLSGCGSGSPAPALRLRLSGSGQGRIRLAFIRSGFSLAMFPRGAVFTFRVLAQQKDGVGGSSLLGFLPRKTDCSASSV